MLFVINLLALTPVRAQQPHPPAEPPPPEHPAIEPAALEMLQAMSQRLAGAKSMSFTAVTTDEAPARDGQPCTIPRYLRSRCNARTSCE